MRTFSPNTPDSHLFGENTIPTRTFWHRQGRSTITGVPKVDEKTTRAKKIDVNSNGGISRFARGSRWHRKKPV